MKRTKTSPPQWLRIAAIGFAMGSADLVPGVSGGTIAFLSGIYEQLINAIKTLTGHTLRLLLKGKLREAYKSIPFSFVLPLGGGLLLAVFALANLLSYLLETHPVFVWSFFLGLVLASTLIVMRRVSKWEISHVAAFTLAATVAYNLIGLVPVETPATLPFFFVSGAIAICAMILPGISGSFLLLLMGKYQQILQAVTSRDVLTLGVFISGCAVGIAVFSRLLSWLLKTHHDISIAVLSGFMLGSVRKLWPWKEIVATRINSHGIEVPLVEKNVLPPQMDMSVIFAILLAAVAAYFMWWLNAKHLIQEQKIDKTSK